MGTFLNRVLGVAAGLGELRMTNDKLRMGLRLTACGAALACGLRVSAANVTDPTGAVTLSVPGNVTVEPSLTQITNDDLQITNGSMPLWVNVSPLVTGQATATATTTAAPSVSYADSALASLDAGRLALCKLDETAAVAAQAGGVAVLTGTYSAVSATAFGGVTAVPGKVGGAFQFNGTNQYVSLGNPAALNFTGKISISAWIKPEATDGTRNIVVHGYSHSPNGELGLRIGSGQYQIFSWNGSSHLAGATIPAGDIGTWVHLLGVYDGTTWRLYRNGVQVAAKTDAIGAVAVNVNWAIGAHGVGTERFFKGAIDEVGIWNRALTAADAAMIYGVSTLGAGMSSISGTVTRTWTAADGFGATVSGAQVITVAHTVLPGLTVPADATVELGMDMSPAATGQATATPAGVTVTSADAPMARLDNGLKAMFRLDEAAETTTVANLGGNLAGGVIHGAIPGLPGKIGGALSFNGSGSYVSIPGFGLNSNTVTLSGWVKRNGTQADYVGLIFSRDPGTIAGLSLRSTGELRYFWRNANSDFVTGLIIPDNVWTFVALVVEPTKATVYMKDASGLRAAVRVATHALAAFAGEIRLGHDSYSTTRCFKGMLDDVAIWNRALSAEELTLISGMAERSSGSALSVSQLVGSVTRTWTATDAFGYAAAANQRLNIVHVWPPVVTVPAEVTINGNESRLPARTGLATASDFADGAVTVTYVDPKLVRLSGLQAYWSFDGGVPAGVVADNSGRGNNGTVKGSVTAVAANIGQSLHFVGTGNGWVYVPLNVSETAYAISLWFRTTQANCGIYSARSSVTGGHDRHLYLLNGQLKARVWSNEIITSSCTGLNDGQWHHVVHTFGGTVGGQKLYVDGALVASGIRAQSDFSAQDHIALGYSVDSVAAPHFTGDMDDVAIWSQALTQADVTEIHADGVAMRSLVESSATAACDTLVQGARAHCRLDETIVTAGQVGGVAVLTGTNNAVSGTAYGGVTTVTGQVGGAYQFNGTSGDVTLSALNLNSNTVTISGWVKRSGTPTDYTGLVFCRESGTSAGLNLRSTGNLCYHWNGAYNTYSFASGLTVPDGVWTFVAVVVEPTKATLYMSSGGVLRSAVNKVSHATQTFSGLTHIGRDPASGFTRYLNGAIDDVAIWNRALSATEIAQAYARGQGGVATMPTLVASLAFNRVWTAADSAGNAASGTQAISLTNLQKDSDGDGLNDFQELLIGSDPNQADTDGDGLNDAAEFKLGSDPRNPDTNGDGVPDGWEAAHGISPLLAIASALTPDVNGVTLVQQYLTGITAADFNGTVTGITSVAGATGTPVTGEWSTYGTTLACDSRQGSVDYTLTIPATGQYGLWVSASQAIGISTETSFMVEVLVDGVSCGISPIQAINGGIGRCRFWPPQLSAGNHAVRVVWHNIASATSLEIVSLGFETVGGADTDNNGQADWSDKRMSFSVTLDETTPATSAVSPVCIEGGALIPEEVNVHSSYIPEDNTLPLDGELLRNIVRRAPANRWFANVPLDPAGLPTNLTATAWSDGKIVAKAIAWTPTNVFTAANTVVTVRVGDSLLLAVKPDGAGAGAGVVNAEGVNHVPAEGAAAVPVKFNTAGNITITAQYTPETSTPVTANMTVHVVGGGFSSHDVVCLLGRTRIWSNPLLPAEAVLTADGILSMSEAPYDPGVTWRQQSLTMSTDAATAYVIARISQNGPILDNASVRGISWYSSALDSFVILNTYDDGSRLVEGRISMSYIPADFALDINIFVGGVTFEDGTVNKRITAADFDSSGEVRFRFIMAYGVQTSTCHTVTFSQGGTGL